MPACTIPEHSMWRIDTNGTYDTLAGPRQRYRCSNPDDSAQRHTFSAPLPRALVADDTCCEDCQVPTPRHAGTEAATLGNATSTAAGVVSATGAIAGTLANATASLSSTETFVGTIAGALSGATCSASGTVSAGSDATGTIAATLNNTTASITATETSVKKARK
jgi:hypothetical protein